MSHVPVGYFCNDAFLELPPAEKDGLPPQDEPTEAQITALVAACAAQGIKFMGPPVA